MSARISRTCLSEDELHGLVEVDDARREAIDAHIDGCPRCLDLLAAAAIGAARGSSSSGSCPGELSTGRTLVRGVVLSERFEVGELVGAGGMGVVYAAHDRVLDREVALKVLRRTDAEVRGRLLAEAQMLARLAHPNVIVVFDVVAGDDAVFLAMELVRGETLRTWVEGPPRRSVRAIVQAYVDAGRGLAAAHRQGIVHCDFKADNVLVGVDGRVRVTDFGLARSPEREGQTGSWLVGTPRYMSPEQLSGRPGSARSDQFAFAVALYEALTGRGPFAAVNVAAIKAGPQGLGRGFPRWLDPVVARALACDPEDRFATIDALCDALERGLGRRAWRWTLASGAAALGIALGGIALPAKGKCGDPSQLLEAAWNAQARHVLVARAGPDEEVPMAKLIRTLDATAEAWLVAYGEVCLGEEGRQESSRICLEQSLEVLRKLVNAAGSADGPTLAFLAKQPLEYRLVASCLEVDVVRPPPFEPAQLALRMRLEEVQRLFLAGKLGAAMASVREVLAEAEALEYPPLLVEALLRHGQVELRRGEVLAAQATLERALALAEDTRYDAILPEIWLELTIVDASLGLLSGARRGIGHTERAFARRGESRATEGRVRSLRSHYLYSIGRYHEAFAAGAEAEAIYATLPSSDVAVASALSAQGLSLAALGRWEEVIDLQERALALRLGSLGGSHTRVAASLNNIGEAYLARGYLSEARAYLRRALAIRVALGDDGELDRSHVLLNLGRLGVANGEPTTAHQHFRKALAIRERLLGAEHLLWVEVALELGALEVASGIDREGGAARVRVAYERRLAVLGAEHPLTALALGEVGIAKLWVDSPERAREVLERAALALAKAEVQPEQRARVGFALARAKLDAGEPPTVARAEAERALAIYRKLGRGGIREVATIEAWLAQQDGIRDRSSQGVAPTVR